jgi:hypothetical protein
MNPVGLGLDEEALKAARHWRIAPAVDLNTSKPISFPIKIEVKFFLHSCIARWTRTVAP